MDSPAKEFNSGKYPKESLIRERIPENRVTAE
jgi:hypothetical protein